MNLQLCNFFAVILACHFNVCVSAVRPGRGKSSESFQSGHTAEFTPEMLLHFSGIRNVDNPAF
jgi:hypothetical protein